MEHDEAGADGEAYGYHFIEGAGFIEISVIIEVAFSRHFSGEVNSL